MSGPHTTFGDVDVRGRSSFDRHWVTPRPEGVLVEGIDLHGVEVRFGWSSERPWCGKCRSGLRAVDGGDGTTVWIAQDGRERQPHCEHTVWDESLTDEEVVAQMFHELDRSVGSWCHAAAIHVDDAADTLKFVARTERHKIVVDVRLLPGGEVSVQTVRKRRRRNREAS